MRSNAIMSESFRLGSGRAKPDEQTARVVKVTRGRLIPSSRTTKYT